MTANVIRKTVLWLAGAACVLAAAPRGAAQAAFSDDFSSYASGTDASPAWRPIVGTWSIRDGIYHQTESGFDMAATSAFTPSGRYTFSVRSRANGGFVGGGLFFNMQNRDSVANSQMVRLDPEGVMWGPINVNREFQFAGMHDEHLATDRWYTLSVAVDPDLAKYNVLLDGKIVGRNLDLRTFTGSIGLQSSGGPNAFDDVVVRPATPEELEGLKIKRPFNAPQDVAIGPLNRLYVAHRGANTVAVVSTGDPTSSTPIPFGKVVAEFAPRGTGEARVMDPAAVALTPAGTDSFGDVLVLDRMQDAVKVYAQDGTFRRAFSTRPLARPTDMALLPDGGIVVVSADANTVAVFRPDGTHVGSSTDGLKNPHGVAVDPAGRILVADTDNNEIAVFMVAGGEVCPAGRIPGWLHPRALAVADNGDLIHLGDLGFYEEDGAVRRITPRGRRVAHFAGYALGGIGRNGSLALASNGAIYVVDTDKDRIVVVPPDMNEPRPHVEVKDDRATITWVAPGHASWPNTEEPTTVFRYGEGRDPSAWTTLNVRTLETPAAARPANASDNIALAPRPIQYRVAVTGLRPNTIYYYRFGPTLQTIPAGSDPDGSLAAAREISGGAPLVTDSKTYSFLSAPPAGQMPYVNVKGAVAIYLNTDNNGKTFRLPRAELGDRIQRMMERGRLFYWRNSHFTFHQDLEYVVIENAVADISSGLPPVAQVRKDIQAARDFQGKNIDDYPSVFAIWVGPRYHKDQPEAIGEVHGGGLTPYGYSAFSAEDTIAWLNVHEYNHQLDSFFDKAGYSEYWLNHPDDTIHPGRYGGQYDVNAFILREWPVNDWFWLPANGVGTVRLTPDADGDGVPDNDTHLPLDEARFGSSPRHKDTDNDGLDDLGEAMAGIFRGSDPRDPDTDGDGIPDGRDPWPLDAAVQDRPRKTPTLDGVIMPGEWTELAPLTGPYTGRTYLNSDENAIYVAAILDRPANLHIQLDPQNDGLFGPDNIELTADATRPTAIGQEVPIRNGRGAWGIARDVNGRTVVEIAIPRSPAIGLMPQMEQTMGLGIQIYDLTADQERWMSVFEPWRLWTFRLMDPNMPAVH